jgi:hypothetical protein
VLSCGAEPEASAKEQLLDLLSDYVNEKVVLADQVLVGHAVSKVYDGDVILTYAYSQVRNVMLWKGVGLRVGNGVLWQGVGFGLGNGLL